MVDRPRKYDDELAGIMDAIAESVLEIPDEELEAEIGEEAGQVEETRNLLLNAVKAYRQRNLLEAERRYNERAALMQRKKYDIPESVHEQRDLLFSLLASNPTARSLLTAQHRDFSDLPDDEIANYLKHLIELGVTIPPTNSEDDEK
jgi:hypothetical protein